MRWRARIVAAVAVLLAVLLQGAFITRLGIPFALTPVVAVVVAMRLTRGEAAVIGFIAGLLLDIAPPAETLLGLQALLLCLASYFASANQSLVPQVWWLRAMFAGVVSTVTYVIIILGELIAGEPVLFGWMVAISIGLQLVAGTLVAAALWPAAISSMGPPPRRRMGVAP